jgi:hypothetical protein
MHLAVCACSGEKANSLCAVSSGAAGQFPEHLNPKRQFEIKQPRPVGLSNIALHKK